jgi:hypothetical protein
MAQRGGRKRHSTRENAHEEQKLTRQLHLRSCLLHMVSKLLALHALAMQIPTLSLHQPCATRGKADDIHHARATGAKI